MNLSQSNPQKPENPHSEIGNLTVLNQPSTPMISFGVPIRNSEKFLPILFDSLLAQEFENFEVVISDNASDDGTKEICERYAARDSRIKYFPLEENIGQNPNFLRVLELAKGKYFRWIGDDDWVEKDYARRCIDLLEANESFIGVTTYQDFFYDDGAVEYSEYTGERLESNLPHIRYKRMIWFMTCSDHTLMDPIYTMFRRDALRKIQSNKESQGLDQLISIELSLIGRIAHIPLLLSHRRKVKTSKIKRSVTYYVGSQQMKPTSSLRKTLDFWEIVQKSDLSNWEKLMCVMPTIQGYLRRIWKRSLPRKSWCRLMNKLNNTLIK